MAADGTAKAGKQACRPAELLSPAGDMERLRMALAYGADAVYLSGPRFGLRAAAGNFSDGELTEAVLCCHDRGVRVYAACNALLRGDDLKALPPYLEFLETTGVDAVILTDLGAFALAAKHAPGLPRHVSTQAGVMNAAAARAFYDMGASRIILARELTLSEIAELRAGTPAALELEAFVHGSMCMAFSSRCLLSSYLAGRDASRGECAQPCRWKYYLTEEKRPGEFFGIEEDSGTYIFNSRDLCMIEHLPEMLGAGITCFKIEGRMKSAYYAAAVTNAYRHALDAAERGEALPEIWRREVYKVSHREYSTGFYFNRRGPGEAVGDAVYTSEGDIAAVVLVCDADGDALLSQRNRILAGDCLELLVPGGVPVPFDAAGLRDAAGNAIDAAVHPMMEFRLRLPIGAPEYSLIRKLK